MVYANLVLSKTFWTIACAGAIALGLAAGGCGSAGDTPTAGSGGAGHGGPPVGTGAAGPVSKAPSCDGVAQGDDVPVQTMLPGIPGIENVRACMNGDAISVN